MWLISQAGSAAQNMREGLAQELSASLTEMPMSAPVAAAFEARGGASLSQVPGRCSLGICQRRSDHQKPHQGHDLGGTGTSQRECLWDLGAGSGSISVEWCLAGGNAVCVEQHAERVANISLNARRYAVPLKVIHGDSLSALSAIQPQQMRYLWEAASHRSCLMRFAQGLARAGAWSSTRWRWRLKRS